MDDADLIRAYAENGSEAAFAGFVERRIGFVHTAALRMVAGDAHMAQDITQAVFVLVSNKAAMLARHERLAGWLYTATRNVSREMMRNARRRGAREQEAARMSEIEQNDEAVIGIADVSKLRPLLDEALGALREGEREAVLLRYFERRAFAEIGAKLRISEEAARKSVSRAVEKMRGLFARRGVTSSAAAVGALMSAAAAGSVPAGLAASVTAGAVSAAGAAAGIIVGAGGVLGFMGTAKITMAAVIALCIAAGVVYYGAQRQTAAAAGLAEAKRENANLFARLAAAERKQKAARDYSTSGGAAPRRSPKEAREAIDAGRKLMAQNPEIGEKMHAAERAMNYAQSYRIAHDMGLTMREREALADICTNWITITMRDIAGYGTVTLESKNRANNTSRQEYQIRELLGEEGLRKYQEASQRLGAVGRYSKELAASLYFTDTPLTGAQARALEQVCLDLNQSFGSAGADGWWEALTARSRAFLSEEQIVVLSKLEVR